MVRRNIYDTLDNREFSISQEYWKLYSLFAMEKKPYWGYGSDLPLKEYINKAYFRDLECRGSFLSIDSMMQELHINNTGKTTDDLLTLCEFIMAVTPSKQINKSLFAEKQMKTIEGNIVYILDKTNHMLLNLCGTDYAYPKYVIIEKNKAATEAAELVEDENTAIELLEYNRFSLNGDLAEKRRILSSIALYIEPLLKSRKLQKAGYGQLESDAGFLANNFHIRHNNKTGAKANEYIVGLADDDLEYWYDKAYNVFLNVITLREQIETSSELNMLKGNYHWKT